MAIEFRKIKTIVFRNHVSKLLLGRLLMLLSFSIYFFVSGIEKFIRFKYKGYVVILLLIFGFCFGYFVFSNMNRIDFNTKIKKIFTTKIDIIDIVLIGVYILFEALIRIFLKDIYANVNIASAYSTITIGSLIAGRVFSMLKDIQKTYEKHIIQK